MKTGLGQVKHLSTVEAAPLSSSATAELEGWVLANDIGMLRKRFFFFGEKQPEMVWTALHLILQCRTLLFRGPENGRADKKEGRGAPEGDQADQGVKIVIDQLEMAINRKNDTCMRC